MLRSIILKHLNGHPDLDSSLNDVSSEKNFEISVSDLVINIDTLDMNTQTFLSYFYRIFVDLKLFKH